MLIAILSLSLGKTMLSIILTLSVTFLLKNVKGQIYDLNTISTGATPDTVWMKRNTDSLYQRYAPDWLMNYIGKVNPRRYYQWPLIDAKPDNIEYIQDSLNARLRTSAFTALAIYGLIGGTPALASGTSGQYIKGDGTFGTYAAGATYTAGTGIAISGGNVVSNTAPNQTVTLTAGNGIAITGSYPNFTVTYAPSSIDTIAATRAFNTAYQMSTTKYVDVKLYASISPTLSLIGGQSGEIYLELSANGTSGWVQHGKISNGNTGSLTIGLNITELLGGAAIVTVPPGYYWRLRTNNVTGTPTYTFLGGSKTIF